MRSLFNQITSPKFFYQHAERMNALFLVLALVTILLGFVWGLGFVPEDAQQGDAFRMIYVHVPCAFFSMMIYAGMGALSVIFLVWRIKLAGLLLPVFAEVGVSMAILALITGSIWGKPMWGTWWIWDARLTSELILCLLYIAILVIHRTYAHQEHGDRLVAILALVGLIDLPIIHYSVIWWNTLHQGQTLSIFSQSHIDPSMIPPLILMLFGLSLYCLGFILYRAQDILLWRERRQNWVKILISSKAGDV